ncbi:hypothetical protein MPH_01361 [Macrophomina phaseolina MS6]|uniref:Deoxyribonuclease NucA/NucB domain-containing protein n=1 Tax=Macrophomina phaseolina (strain MS6) TaxID=1126212 RepID=K2SFZ9_MACPH|nr:hypothetical protein MPH_01361 [Macrophomina phaseolina MS6]
MFVPICAEASIVGMASTLPYRYAPATTKLVRRASAGCWMAPRSRCISGADFCTGQSHDEIPFASSAQADELFQINRCVPYQQRNSNLLIWRKFRAGAPRRGWLPKRQATPKAELANFRLKSGKFVSAPAYMRPGDKVFHFIIDLNMQAEMQAVGRGEDDFADFEALYGAVELEEDEVDHELTEAKFANETTKANAGSV